MSRRVRAEQASIPVGLNSKFQLAISAPIVRVLEYWELLRIYYYLFTTTYLLPLTLWSRSQRVLRAIDMSLINSTMMPQIVILSIIFLGEFPEILDWIGIIILAFSVTAVQYLQTKRAESQNS